MSQSNSHSHDVRIKYFLSEATDDFFAGKLDVETLAHSHDLSLAEADQLVEMIEQLEFTFDVDIQPDADFKQQLHNDLIGKQLSLFERVRNLPPRLQIAAGIALIAAMALLGRRRFFSEIRPLIQKWRDVQPQTDTNGATREANA